jgi:hypothetical protein
MALIKDKSSIEIEHLIGKPSEIYTKFPPRMGQDMFPNNEVESDFIDVRAYNISFIKIRYLVVKYNENGKCIDYRFIKT